MPWLLTISYWLHLLATVVWLGGLAVITVFAWPALRQGTLAANQWWTIQRGFVPWANSAMIVLLITGFYQMTSDANYMGFLNLDGAWAVAILLKHIAFLGMVIITIYLQAMLYPAMDRLRLLEEQKPRLAAAEQDVLQSREIRLLRINLVCAALVLLFTAAATAV